jgi:hypothetical protein
MCFRLPRAAHPKYASAEHLLRRTVLLTVLGCVLVLTACSGVSVPGSSATTAATNPTASLTISGSLPSGVVGSTYKASVTVAGGTAPYTFSLASGQLPAGVVLGASSGTISGIPTANGNFSFTVSVADSKEVSKQQSLQITVASAPVTTGQGGGKSFSNLQQSTGWGEYGQGPPDFVDCSPSPCDGISFSMAQGVQSPSMSGGSAQFNLGGSAIYSDALFNNHLIGPFSSQGLPDNSQTLVPTFHNFTYDVYFYGTNLELSQAVEFDINQFFNNLGFIWGHECRIAGGHEWDIWDNVNAHWIPTGVACNPVDNEWNHVTIQVQRTASNQLLYQSITLNGVTNTLNLYYNPGSVTNWYGVTINYQMDGNNEQTPYSVYLDNLSFTYE